ncbi:unnamed protein product [Didymodactylos carnosus]|uniref:Uncharacterized protein n=1 Tax=Didymodactylos carnosus TaxID=1234261 RepID=A0A815X9H2_9BILA|nr:unnamed protein product [Didymodactylos carnosus]CAF1554686.1 unnamed protein product [Didymodactylos carnosus]CAF4249174.1 unnamed protein product [Didymodactylos carnosus]CAF4415840.1 unnamed protein product [Didymodactylos carnosus]
MYRPQLKMIHVEVVSHDKTHIFRGNEILTFTIDDMSRPDRPISKNVMYLQPGQQFPIRFYILYDDSRAYNDWFYRLNSPLVVNVQIKQNGRLLYVNSYMVPLDYYIQITASKVVRYVNEYEVPSYTCILQTGHRHYYY